MKLFCFLILSFVLCLFHDTSDARQKKYLNDKWHSTLGDCRLNRPQSQGYEGWVIYHRNVRLPRSFEGKRLRLVMERTKNSTLWVSGDSIGSRTSLCTPHIYDLPAFIDGNAEISVRVDNSPSKVHPAVRQSNAWSGPAQDVQTDWNDILGGFYIEACDSTFISSFDVLPDVSKKSVMVRMTIDAEKAASARLSIDIERYDCMDTESRSSVKYLLDLKEGKNSFSYNVSMGDSLCLWSEYHPLLYKITASLQSPISEDVVSKVFGMRDFSADGDRFTINGNPTFLRGRCDGSGFSLSDYPYMTVYQWRQLFADAKQNGINHWRFSSYIPPHAAFTAADLEGIYIHAELPFCGELSQSDTSLSRFLLAEEHEILREFGSHPSFVLLDSGGLNGRSLHVPDDDIIKSYPEIARVGADRTDIDDETRLSVSECKREIEAALKAENIGGFMLSDVDENQVDSLKSVCSDFVPLAWIGEERLNASDTLNVELSVANYTEQDWSGMLDWTLVVQELLPLTDQTLPDFHGKTNCSAVHGTLSPAGRIFLPLSFLGLRAGETCRVALTLSVAGRTNTYSLWISSGKANSPFGLLQ